MTRDHTGQDASSRASAPGLRQEAFSERPKMRAAGSRRKSGNARGTKQRCVSAPTGWAWRAGRRVETEGRTVVREFCGEKKEAGLWRDAGLLLPGMLKIGFMVSSGTGRKNR